MIGGGGRKSGHSRSPSPFVHNSFGRKSSFDMVAAENFVKPHSPKLPVDNPLYYRHEVRNRFPTFNHYTAKYLFNEVPFEVVDPEFDAVIIDSCEANEPEVTIVEGIAFITRLAHLLHRTGETMHRLQNIVNIVAKHIQVDCSCAMTSNMVLITFGDKLSDQGGSLYHRKISLHTDDQLLDLDSNALSLLNAIVFFLCSNKLTFRQCCSELYTVENMKDLYSPVQKICAMAVSSAAICGIFFAGGYYDILVSLVLGLLVATFGYYAERIFSLGRLQNILSALISSCISFLVVFGLPNLCLSANTLSPFVWLLPGFSFTVAVIELANSNIVSGTSRLFVSLLACLQLGFGVTLGLQLGSAITGGPFLLDETGISSLNSCEKSLPQFMEYLLFFPMMCSWCILLNSRLKDWLPIVITSFATLVIFDGLKPSVGVNVATILTALILGILANGYARLLNRTSTAIFLCGVMLLVPRSIGNLSISAIISTEFISGIGFSFQMMAIGLAITIGISFSNLLVFPNQKESFYSY